MFSVRDAIDHPAANGPQDFPNEEKIQRWIEDNADRFGVWLSQAAHHSTRKMGWIACATDDGEPVGKESSWHDSITTAAHEGELLMDKLIQRRAEEACRE